MALTDTAIVRRRVLGCAVGVVSGAAGAGGWEIESLVLKAAEPIRTPTIPVMISFWMAKGGDSNSLRMPP
jgi:hypothetical protein